MKAKIPEFFADLKQVFYTDIVSRYLFISSIIFFLADFLIWRKYLNTPDVFVYIRIGIYPIKYLAIIMLVNSALALFSYETKEKEVSYLLLMANIIIGFLVLILESFYLFR